MGLDWQADTEIELAESGQEETLSGVSENERILFIGFGQVSGFYSCGWEDWDWLNAADFDSVFLNCGTLSDLLSRCRRQYVTNPEGFSTKWYDRLDSNLSDLREQTLQMINSERAVFALAAPKITWSVGAGVYKLSVDTYSWCPFPVITHNESGEVSKDLDPRFSEYRKQLRRWEFYFDDQPRPVDTIDRHGLRANQRYMVVPKSLFQNLSLRPLGVEMRYGMLSRAQGAESIDALSGPIYLLHYPTGGDLRESMRALLQGFYQTDLLRREVPAWVQSVVPPRGAELEKQIAALVAQIEALSGERVQLVAQRQELARWRSLLYETGEALEQVALDALQLLGLQDVQFVGKASRDIVGELEGQTFLFRARGLMGTATRKEVFDLDTCVENYGRLNPGKGGAKGVLVVNAWRCDPPSARGLQEKQVFASDTVEHAKLLKFALLDTRDLYRLVCDRMEGKLDETPQFLLDLSSTVGIYQYP
jgi:hypothetical protein